MRDDGNAAAGGDFVPAASPTLNPLLPKWLLTALIVLVTIFLVVIIGFGLLRPQHLHTATAKFFVCFGLAFCCSIIMYAIYPYASRLNKVPILELTVDIVGPAALFLVALALLWRLYPEPVPEPPAPKPPGRFYLLRQGSQQPARLHAGAFEINSSDGNCQFHTTLDVKDSDLVGGIYAEFKGESDQCGASIDDSSSVYTATFDRTADTNFVELQNKTK